VTGFAVDPDALRTAVAPRLLAACDQLSGAAGLAETATLPATALGAVDAAGEFAAAVQALVTEHGGDLERGALWVDDAAEAVVQAAGTYEEMDREAVDRFTLIGHERW